jgi:cell wall-associated NlpC family hydrolase
LFLVVWFGPLVIVWKNRALRFAGLTITALTAVFLLLPARNQHDGDALRSGYVSGLLRYEGVRYFWGGESPKGIDCSGLIRRGLIDSLFLRGVRTLDGSLVRHALWIWWNDCTARELGEGHGMTTPLIEAPSINALDPAQVSPGDIAVTANGLHIMAYLGGNRWIEADPMEQRVIIVSVPSKDNSWFHQPMKVVRWNILGK